MAVSLFAPQSANRVGMDVFSVDDVLIDGAISDFGGGDLRREWQLLERRLTILLDVVPPLH